MGVIKIGLLSGIVALISACAQAKPSVEKLFFGKSRSDLIGGEMGKIVEIYCSARKTPQENCGPQNAEILVVERAEGHVYVFMSRDLVSTTVLFDHRVDF